LITEKSDIELIVRGGEWGVQLDVKEFPIICPACNNYFHELFHHISSRYGQVGSVNCSCGETVNLIDSDNIVEFIVCHSTEKSIKIDFKELFRLRQEDFESLRINLMYDIFEKHQNERISLLELIQTIELECGIQVESIESEIPMPQIIKKWLGLIQSESTKQPKQNPNQ